MLTGAVHPHPRRRPEPLQMRERRGDGLVVHLQDPGSPVRAHNTLTDFGAENVASNPATARTMLPSVR